MLRTADPDGLAWLEHELDLAGWMIAGSRRVVAPSAPAAAARMAEVERWLAVWAADVRRRRAVLQLRPPPRPAITGVGPAVRGQRLLVRAAVELPAAIGAALDDGLDVAAGAVSHAGHEVARRTGRAQPVVDDGVTIASATLDATGDVARRAGEEATAALRALAARWRA